MVRARESEEGAVIRVCSSLENWELPLPDFPPYEVKIPHFMERRRRRIQKWVGESMVRWSWEDSRSVEDDA